MSAQDMNLRSKWRKVPRKVIFRTIWSTGTRTTLQTDLSFFLFLKIAQWKLEKFGPNCRETSIKKPGYDDIQ
jgi:hypothetical protein